MTTPLPILALLFNAFVWGLAWWPFRLMHAAGLHPLWATAVMYCGVLVALLALRPGLWAQVRAHPQLWLLALSSGLNNVAFNWAVTVGDVVRVILLFYLMPAWAVLLAWKVLGERPTAGAIARLALAFAGVVLVIWPGDASAQALLHGLSMADGLALLGGFMFALTNVTLRRLHAVPGPARMFSMFGGCMLMALAVGTIGLHAGVVEPFPAPNATWIATAALLAGVLLLGNWALQFGASRLAAGTTAIVMLSEVVFASVSSVLLSAAALQPRTLLGGGMIVLAALLASLQRR
ncbi:DMT family transporter [Acidovorax sp. NCPPB 3859]|nr:MULTISPECIES: DMT family transporter [unclassified Acidovorax]MDA8449932.1 DMT family transporter [Acidovorax sp. GBBC 3297]MDA8459377.1 DMT family transporter [Acidovorax sp. GBBC 3333]MDA8464414.1 DMT family transporter [Acidovorax sp. GBBC 3332]MDA8469375.1 DMT family transporter [Acidovorax sp. GBBC 3299]WCM79011.1 DMT family transporter [Acidovorax sp. GBBC 712]